MVSKVVLEILIPGNLNLWGFVQAVYILLLFTLSHFHNPTLLQDIYFLVFHMPKKWPEMNMDFDLNLAAF